MPKRFPHAFLIQSAGLAVAAAVVATLLVSASTASGKGCGLKRFNNANPPGACWRPFSPRSPFNKPLPTHPRQTADSPSVGSRTASLGTGPNFQAGEAGTADDYAHPIYFASRNAPRYKIDCLNYSGCEVEGRHIRIPRGAQPAGGSDGHLGVIDRRRKWEYDFWQVRDRSKGGGQLHESYGGRTRIGTRGSKGLGSAATAAQFATSLGTIRPEEIRSGRIDHALFMVVKCTNGHSVYPAKGSSAGRACSELGLSNQHAPAMGQHFYLDMSKRKIAALPAPRWKKTILRAMAEYGMFVGDTGGNGWGLMLWSGLSYPGKDPWVKLARGLGLPAFNVGDSTRFLFDLRDTVAWGNELRVARPCVSRRHC
jgi:hypothetical protein